MTEQSQRYMHFTIGPVQGFVAQARRTRDLWSGSFLLSYLSGIAMLAVLKADGSIDFPYVGGLNDLRDPLLQAIYANDWNLALDKREGKKATGQPNIGSLPNRFKAKIPDKFDPNECVRQVEKQWEKIADAVWERYLEPYRDELAEIRGETRAIWERQVRKFWDMAWVIGEEDNLLDRRKNWRTHIPTVESGSKCTIMSGYQELSGHERAGYEERKLQDRFWSVVNKGHCLDLRSDERLCAISFIKRVFSYVAEETIGWTLPTHFPSTSAVAALPWVAERIEADPERCRAIVNLLPKKYSEQQIAQSHLITRALSKHKEDRALKDFASLDGQSFFTEALKNERLWDKDSTTENVRKEVVEQLEAWEEKPSPFYAQLFMDGDRLGEMLQQEKGAGRRVSLALAKFTGQVEEIVKRWSGFLIYAGGDDVLAMLPAESALDAAIELRGAYQEAFAEENRAKSSATISAAIVFAHHFLPLHDVLGEAHRLLDETAKEKTGRDSIAATILRPSGTGFTWAAPWTYLLNQQPAQEQQMAGANRLKDLVEKFKTNKKKTNPLNSNFLYNLRSRYELLKSEDPEFDENFYIRLFTAEFIKGREEKIPHSDVEQTMAELYGVCRKVYRTDNKEIKLKDHWSIDGALLVKFLAERGREA